MNNFANRLKGIPSEMRSHTLDLPEHLTESGDVDKLSHLLTDLHFIEAKCAEGMTYDLIADYEAALDVLPEAQEEKQKVLEHEQRIKKYAEDMINYARDWNDARERHATDPKNNPMPEPEDIPLPEIIPSVEPWSEEKIRKDTERIINNPTRLDRIRAFSQFVNAESHILAKFGSERGFCFQQAYNSTHSGPVAEAVECIINTEVDDILLLQLPSSRLNYSPHPALLKRLEGHTFDITSVSITPDGKRAISGDGLGLTDGTLRVWNLETGECLNVLRGHTSRIQDVSITPDGMIGVSCSMDCTIRKWDLETGECLKVLKGHKKDIEDVSITPDGKMAVSGSEDHTVRVWDLETGECLKVLKEHEGLSKNGFKAPNKRDTRAEYMRNLIECVDITPDGKIAVSGNSENTARVWDIETSRCLKTLKGHTHSVISISITPDRKKAVSGSYDHTVRVWNLETGKCLKVLKGHSDEVKSVSITPDGKIAVSVGGRDTTIWVWNLETGECLRVLKGHTGGISSVGITPDGKKAVSAGGFEHSILVWNIQKGEPLKMFEEHKDEVYSLSVTPDGKKAVSKGGSTIGYKDFAFRVWDMETGEYLKTLEGHTDTAYVSFTPDGKTAVSGSLDETLRVWDIEGGRCLRTLEGGKGRIFGAEVTPDGKRIVGSREGLSQKEQNICMWDLETGKCLKMLEGHTYWLRIQSITPDGRRAMSTQYMDINPWLWDLETGKCLKMPECHPNKDKNWLPNKAESVTTTPDWKVIVSGSSSGIIRVWNLETGECLKVLEGHKSEVNSVTTTPDGKTVISGSSDKTLRVWNLETGECLKVLEGHSDGVKNVVVTPDGKLTITGSKKTLRLWVLESGECIAIYQARNQLQAVSEIRANGHFGIGTYEGEVIFLTIYNMPMEPPLVTPFRIWLYGGKGNRGRWDDDIIAVCQWCSQRFPVADEILEVIMSITRDVNISPDQSSCLELPAEAWDDPRLLSECPLCHKPLMFNPFVVDNRGRW